MMNTQFITNEKKLLSDVIKNNLPLSDDSRQDGLQVRFQDETVWLTQKLMSELFQCSPDNVSLHLKKHFQRRRTGEKISYRGILGNCQRWQIEV
jgi:hypothetical protein